MGGGETRAPQPTISPWTLSHKYFQLEVSKSPTNGSLPWSERVRCLRRDAISDAFVMASLAELSPRLYPHAISAPFPTYPDIHIEQHEEPRSPAAFAMLAAVGVRTLALSVHACLPPDWNLLRNIPEQPSPKFPGLGNREGFQQLGIRPRRANQRSDG